ncbi:organic cation transporter protein-like [Choristoneura fumiferana]|uniref:organic cation transporter protein-like n=1 Tax=Choristoneura fumiferana TaxID=7141 RepID=UPI003D159026
MPITGYVSDRWGRRTALTIFAFVRGCFGFVRSWADSYVLFIVLHFLQATFGFGAFSCAYILVMELMGPKYRVVGGATVNTFFAVGKVCAGLLAWAVPHWRQLHRAIYAPMFICIIYYWIMPESVRWYMSKGRYAESEAVLKEAARINGTELSTASLTALRESEEEAKRKKELEEIERAKEPLLIVQVFRNKQILLRCLVTPVWWVTYTFVYYGLSINAVNMSGNRYVNYVAVSAVEIPGYWTAVLLLGIIGRKPVLIIAFWLCSACQIAYIFMPEGYEGLSLAVYLIGMTCIAMVITSVYVYTTELYPTKYRHSLFAFSSMVGRIGSVLAPLTPAMGASTWEQLPFALFGGFALLSGCLVFILPETLGAKFPDTMEEAAQIGNKKQERT